ncbi:MAG: pantothenate kinase [Treponema sp.]|jgi:type II pantothenate kinase|nr:pantothenate kinase [Treponema sp.]
MIIGIDIGSTTTKAVSLENGRVVKKIKTRAEDAVTSATGAFGKMILENGIKMPEIKRIMITGAGATKIEGELFGIPTEKVSEITAIGTGGMFLSGQDNIVIVNIGTGTAVIEANKDRIIHLGGSGVGGGTILGLGKKLLSLSDFKDIMALADSGNLDPVDLLLEDIMETDISFLNKKTTASNFGKMLDTARNEDIAMGIVNIVYEVIGMLAVFAARSRNIDGVIVTGSGSRNPLGQKRLAEITRMHSIAFEYPEDGEYTTAVGAGLCGEKNP